MIICMACIWFMASIAFVIAVYRAPWSDREGLADRERATGATQKRGLRQVPEGTVADVQSTRSAVE